MVGLQRLKANLLPEPVIEARLPDDPIEKFQQLVVTKEARPLTDLESRELLVVRRTPEVKDLLRRMRLKTYKSDK